MLQDVEGFCTESRGTELFRSLEELWRYVWFWLWGCEHKGLAG